ncbi:kinesin-like protein, partial [Elysia marginata]
NIRVLCRLRPWIEEDGPRDGNTLAVNLDPDDDGVVKVSNKGRMHQFDFDKAFGIDSTQSQVFEEVSSLVRSSLDGFKVCIFAYGQTGSGKTYTMEGPPSDTGIQQRALQLLFDEAKDPDWNFTISASMLEVYNETIIDLLSPNQSVKLEAKLQPDGILDVPGLTQVTVNSQQQVEQVRNAVTIFFTLPQI